MNLKQLIAAAFIVAANFGAASAAEMPIYAVRKIVSNPEQFCPRGWEIENSITADLQSKGRKDRVIMLTSSKRAGSSGMQQTSYRALLVAFAKGNKLQLADWSTKMLLCTTCGGQLGAEINLEKAKKGFKVTQHGGGGIDSFDYCFSFNFDATIKKFVLTQASKTIIGDRVNQDDVDESDYDFVHGLETVTKTLGGKEKKVSQRFKPRTIFLRQIDVEKLDPVFKI